VFVTLYALDGYSGADVKIERAKNLVLRFYESHQSDRRTFLEEQIGIPLVWFDEALCHRAMQKGDLTGVVHHMLSYAPTEAIRLYDHGLLPKDFFETESGYEDIRKLDDSANIASSLMAAVQRYIDFEDVVKQLRADPQAWNTEDIEELHNDVYRGLVETFRHHQETTTVPLVYYQTTELTGRMVVSAIRERLDQQRLLLKDVLMTRTGEARLLY
jgi:hypothetical protein